MRAKYMVSLGLFLTVAHTAAAETVTLTGRDAFVAAQKSTCGTTEQARTRYGIFEGRAYSRVPGEKDRHLFDVLGINVRHCKVVDDERRGSGFRSVSREIMVYMDPASGEILDTWSNPWTGKDVTVLHVANDPVNMRAFRYERDDAGSPAGERTLRVYGDLTASSAEVPLFYRNPLGGDYQAYVGGMYQAMEIFNTYYSTERILDASVDSVGDSHLSWSRVAQWLPWLEMGDRPGMMIFNATGFSTFDRDKIPAALTEILDERYPLYWTPPPLDDERPNETSWTVFRRHLESGARTGD
ncbi:MAG: DUF1838 family protein [Woeseiaceae bacterium]|nr:DUF1838 family protein [Woeseiaceae bacterium]